MMDEPKMNSGILMSYAAFSEVLWKWYVNFTSLRVLIPFLYFILRSGWSRSPSLTSLYN